MHMHGEPQTMQRRPMEGDAVPQVLRFLRERSALRAGVSRARVLGSGHRLRQDVEQNFALLGAPDELLARGYPLLAAGRASPRWAPSPAAAVSERLPASRAAGGGARRASCACTT
jgi:dihydropteroate synthase